LELVQAPSFAPKTSQVKYVISVPLYWNPFKSIISEWSFQNFQLKLPQQLQLTNNQVFILAIPLQKLYIHVNFYFDEYHCSTNNSHYSRPIEGFGSWIYREYLLEMRKFL
jgi:hypothetical protein